LRELPSSLRNAFTAPLVEPEVVPLVVPEVVPLVVPEVVPDVVPEVVPEVVPVVTPPPPPPPHPIMKATRRANNTFQIIDSRVISLLPSLAITLGTLPERRLFGPVLVHF